MNSAAAPACPDDGLRRPASVETSDASLPDQSQGFCEFGLHQPLPGRKWLSVGEENFGRRRKFLEILGRGREHVHVALIQQKSGLSQFDGGIYQRGARHRPELFARMFQTGHGAGNADGEPARRAQPLDDVAVLVQEHVARRRTGRFLTKVEKLFSAIGKQDGHEAAAAEIAGGRIDHGQRISHRDRSIDRIAAALEDVDADPGRKVLGRDHHGFFRGHGSGRRRMGG